MKTPSIYLFALLLASLFNAGCQTAGNASCAPQQCEIDEVVKAKRVELYNEDGKQTISMGSEGDQTSVWIGESGNQIQLNVKDDGHQEILLRQGESQNKITIATDPGKGKTGIQVGNELHHNSIVINVFENGAQAILLRSAGGKNRVAITDGKDRRPKITLYGDGSLIFMNETAFPMFEIEEENSQVTIHAHDPETREKTLELPINAQTGAALNQLAE